MEDRGTTKKLQQESHNMNRMQLSDWCTVSILQQVLYKLITERGVTNSQLSFLQVKVCTFRRRLAINAKTETDALL